MRYRNKKLPYREGRGRYCINSLNDYIYLISWELYKKIKNFIEEYHHRKHQDINNKKLIELFNFEKKQFFRNIKYDYIYLSVIKSG
ncbi:hypothetical protein SAMN05421544_11351 [Riemerella columbipharyngis]|uniref:Uncharacterized protein n=1 Tax=Riemerella columbipharyngis TaxID=1071918 RepID=A0A1G7DZW9_9FLAO|nr:hypothetical protein SAMN05421544_11351 [Riemerella columbipharyngis]